MHEIDMVIFIFEQHIQTRWNDNPITLNMRRLEMQHDSFSSKTPKHQECIVTYPSMQNSVKANL